MRTMITSVVISVLLGSFTGAAAQLQPEIMVDSYLLQGQQAVRDGDLAEARAAINKIINLQKEHELDLADDFHFRRAQVAAAADLPEPTLEAVVKYLAATGREGEHYVEALELMNKAQVNVMELAKNDRLKSEIAEEHAAGRSRVERHRDAGTRTARGQACGTTGTASLRPDARGPLRVIRPRHAVADPAVVEDVGRLFRVVSQLAAELFYEGANQVFRVAVVLVAPDLAQQGIVGRYPSRVDRERAQQLELGGRQLHLAASHRDPALVVVDGQIAQHEGAPVPALFGADPAGSARRRLPQPPGS